jgi:transaldolase
MADISSKIHDFVGEAFEALPKSPRGSFGESRLWQALCQTGTEPWLDTGSIEQAGRIWSLEFSALTTNNTLLNREVQQGAYDEAIRRTRAVLSCCRGLSQADRILETAFILNALHGLRLVERFGAYVSVEEHTAVAGDVERSVEYGRRFHAICPQRFIVKIPLTPAGLLAARRLSAEGIAVNHTLGFSARQNYIMARIARPAFVNVFLGRLNSFVADNNLGDGNYVGEKATLASQAAIAALRKEGLTESRQIAASFRQGRQVLDLAGVDVMTIPPKVASQFASLEPEPADIKDRTNTQYKVTLRDEKGFEAARLNTLWDIDENLIACCRALEKENLDAFTAGGLAEFFRDHGCGDIFASWTDEQVAASYAEGKIPKLENWRAALREKTIGLDSLMNLAGLNSFAADQKAMDERIGRCLDEA